jgi:hypothetical protein
MRIEAMTMDSSSSSAEDARARRAARRVGLIARRSRWRIGSIEHYGGFQLINRMYNAVVAGERLDLSAKEVIEYCT